jgi:hypothetical protein
MCHVRIPNSRKLTVICSVHVAAILWNKYVLEVDTSEQPNSEFELRGFALNYGDVTQTGSMQT